MSIIEKAKFRRPARPGDSLKYMAEVLSVNELGGRVAVRASSDGNPVAQCTLVFSFHEFENAVSEKCRAELLSLWLEA